MRCISKFLEVMSADGAFVGSLIPCFVSTAFVGSLILGFVNMPFVCSLILGFCRQLDTAVLLGLGVCMPRSLHAFVRVRSAKVLHAFVRVRSSRFLGSEGSSKRKRFAQTACVLLLLFVLRTDVLRGSGALHNCNSSQWLGLFVCFLVSNSDMMCFVFVLIMLCHVCVLGC